MDASSHAPQLPRSCTYQPPSLAGVRLAAVRLLGRAVAMILHNSRRAPKRGPELARELAQVAGSTVLTISCANRARSLQMQVRTARDAAPERLAVKSVKSLCRALAIVPESLLAELPCHAVPWPVRRPAHHHLAHSSKSSSKSPSFSPARANRQSSMRRDLHPKLAFPPGHANSRAASWKCNLLPLALRGPMASLCLDRVGSID